MTENNLVEKRLTHGVHDVAWAPLSFDENNKPIFGKIQMINGITDFQVDGITKPETINADDGTYSKGIISSAATVNGKITTYHLGKDFSRYALGWISDNNNVVLKFPNSGQPFALIFKKWVDLFDGTQDEEYNVYYYIDTYKPEDSTKTDSTDKTEGNSYELTLTVHNLKVIDGYKPVPNVSVYSSQLSNEVKNNWYNEVYVPDLSEPKTDGNTTSENGQ